MRYTIRNMVLIMVVVFMNNCGSSRVNLIKNNTISIDKVHSQRIYVGNVDVYQDSDTLQISGRFIPRSQFHKFLKGHADIVIIDQDSKVVKKTSVVTFPKYRRRRRSSGLKEIKFSVRIAAIPPSGSVVRVVFHEDTPKFIREFDCGGNIALQNDESN